MIEAIRQAVERDARSLDDIRARAVWRRIERAIAADAVSPPAAASGARGRLLAGCALAIGFAAAGLLLAGRGADDGAALRSERALGPERVEVAGVSAWTVGGARASLRVYARRLALLVVDDGEVVGESSGVAEVRLLAGGGVSELDGPRFRVEVTATEVIIASAAREAEPVRDELDLFTAPPAAGDGDRAPPAGPDAEAPVETPTGSRSQTHRRRPARSSGARDREAPAAAGSEGPAALPSVDQLYAAAEEALRSGQLDRADELLAAIVAAEPVGRFAAQARFDRALIALRRGDRRTAVRRLRLVVASHGAGDLRAAARRLLCSLDADAPDCS